MRGVIAALTFVISSSGPPKAMPAQSQTKPSSGRDARCLPCDVVVVGCGVAGLSAALTAIEAGSSVILIERAPRSDRGGNTRWTEAILRVTPDGDPAPDFEQESERPTATASASASTRPPSCSPAAASRETLR